MGKRFAVLLLIVLVACVILLGYFINQSRKTFLTDPYKAIGPDACIVIETIDLRNLVNSVTTGKGLFAEIENLEELSGFRKNLNYFADQINKPVYKKILQEGTAIMSFHPDRNGRLIPFLSKTVPAESSFRSMKDALQQSVIHIFEQKVSGKRVIGIPYTSDTRTDTLFVTINSGLLICSPSINLMMNALVKSSQETDIRDTPGFSRILLSAGEKEDRVFIVFSNLKEIVRNILPAVKSDLAERVIKLGGCAGGDIHLQEEGVTFSGYSESEDPSEVLFRYKSIEPSEFHTFNILPSATALFESLIFNTSDIFKGKREDLSPEILEIASKLKPFMGDEITRAYIDIKNNPYTENSLVIYELLNRIQSENIFLENLGRKSEIEYFKPDELTKIPVYHTELSGLASAVLPGFAPGFNDSWFAFYDNFLITGSSYAAISRLLYDNMLNKTLANDMLYRDFEKQVPSKAGYLFYCVPSHCIDFLSDFINDKIISALRTNRSSLDKIQSVGFQLASINGMIYNNLTIGYKNVVREESKTEWETLLDTAAGIKPFFFTNHNTGAKEIFIQDLKNNAYLINTAGRVLWKVPLKERITGSIYMIDYYRNGKYQLLFSGRNNLHLLDRNGNYVERYPVRLRSPATNSLALFDYDNNNTYRIVIAGEDKLVYSYDKSGNIIKGWEPFRTAGHVTAEAGFYKVSGKDYIVIADEFSVYFLDRSGKVRLRPDEAVIKAKESAIRLTTGSEPSLVCTSPDGTIQNVSFSGKVNKFSFRKFSDNHSFDFFDIDGDGSGEYIFIDSSRLYLFDQNRKEIFRKDFSSEMLGGPICFIFSSNDRKIGVFDITKSLIYLLDNKGEIAKGFPLRGASMFSIGKLSSGNDWNLIVGGTDRFLYNYKLDKSQ